MKLWACLFLLCLPSVGSAQSAFEPAWSCAAPYVTIQRADCTVAQQTTCAADLPGEHRRVVYGPDGLIARHHYGPEYQWIESYWFENGVSRWLVDGSRDLASLSELLVRGYNTFHFETVTDSGTVVYFIGENRLTGEKVFIDGVPFLETEITIITESPLGHETWRAEGTEYVHQEWRSFHAGNYIQTSDGVQSTYDRTPVEIFFPGDPGYASVVPLYGCDDVIISELIE